MSQTNQPFVIDCSATMSLVFLDERSSITKKIESSLIENEAVVPSIWSYETANVLYVAERSKRISVAEVEEIADTLENLPIAVDSVSATKTLGKTLHLAREYKLTVYDAAYLELAMRKGTLLCTFDKALIIAAKRADVKLLK